MGCEPEPLLSYKRLSNCSYLIILHEALCLFLPISFSACVGPCSWFHHPLHPWPQLLDWPHCEVLCNHCVLPPHVLPYRTNLCHLKRCVHQVPPPFPTVSPYLTSSHELVLQYCGGNPLGPSSSLLWPPRSHYYISEMPVIPPYK